MTDGHLISIVGAGPGDPELLTVKAHKRLKEADVILYDASMGSEMLQLAKPDAIKKFVGKSHADGQDQTVRQDAIHREFLIWAAQDKRIIRLKAGDPMVYGRGAEEIRFCKECGLNYEVIPGLTAGVAASSLFSLPLTERGKNNLILFYTGQDKGEGFPDIDTSTNVLKNGSPVIVYMGLKTLPLLSQQLVEKGVDPSLPVQILSRISQKDQSHLSTTLADVSTLLSQEDPPTPTLVIIGRNTGMI
ncbi:uroporphyrinogen-III C-methyltransferase [Saccharicrinis sp. FJH54]|uniref:uroporphyrinogen-III C-methyltransferase n=1 Tax=Saccharicrinis sp. FJH54 TaxID=3344665 RepID=UPI0035D4805A